MIEIEILELLNQYDSKRITREYLAKQNILIDDIESLLTIEALKKTNISGIYTINKKIVQCHIIRHKLKESQIITRKYLIEKGISDSSIREMVAKKELFIVERGVYSSKQPVPLKKKKRQPVKTEVSPNSLENQQVLLINDLTVKAQEALEKKDLDSLLAMLDSTQKDEYIELSKLLWKYILIQIFPKQIEPESNIVVSKKEEDIQNDEKELVEISSVQETKKEEEKLPEIIDKEESSSQEEDDNVANIAYTPTGLKKEELYELYSQNFMQDPDLAQEFLLEYMDRCKEENILFDHKELSTINLFKYGMGIPKDQLKEEKRIKEQINILLKKPETQETLIVLERTLNQFYELYQDRWVLSSIYKGRYEAKVKHYKKAMDHYNQVLKKEPWNTIALNELSKVLLSLEDSTRAMEAMKQNLKYNPFDYKCRLRLARTYLLRNEIGKVSAISKSQFFRNKEDFARYLKEIIDEIEVKIDQYKKFLVRKTEGSKSICEKIDFLYQQLEYYEEMYSQQLDYSDIESTMISGQSELSFYEDSVYDIITDNEDGIIRPMEVKPYIQNLKVSEEEELLYYIAAAKIMFINKLPNCGSYYLKLVSQRKGKSSFAQEQYMQCQRNKKLYLNK